MKHVVILVIGAAVGCGRPTPSPSAPVSDTSASRQAILPVDGLGFAAFSLSTLNYGWTFIQGTAGAQGSIAMNNIGFESGTDDTRGLLVTGQNLDFSRGSIVGDAVVAGDVTNLDHADFSGMLYVGGDASGIDPQSTSVRPVGASPTQIRSYLSGIATSVETLVQDCSSRSATARTWAPDASTLVISGDAPQVNVSLMTSEINLVKTLRFEGTDDQTFVVVIYGEEDVVLRGLDVQMAGPLVGSVMFIVPESRNVTIERSANAEYGLPMAIVAPKAAVRFHQGLVTGSVIGASLEGRTRASEPGGHIIHKPFAGDMACE